MVFPQSITADTLSVAKENVIKILLYFYCNLFHAAVANLFVAVSIA